MDYNEFKEECTKAVAKLVTQSLNSYVVVAPDFQSVSIEKVKDRDGKLLYAWNYTIQNYLMQTGERLSPKKIAKMWVSNNHDDIMKKLKYDFADFYLEPKVTTNEKGKKVIELDNEEINEILTAMKTWPDARGGVPVYLKSMFPWIKSMRPLRTGGYKFTS